MRRENPWHIRLPQASHDQWFKNLVDLHELTNIWINDLKVDQPSHVLTRGLSNEIRDQLWMLDTLAQANLDQFLDANQPHELLLQLEKTIWAVQSWTLQQILNDEALKPRSSSPIKNLLEQISWKAGRRIGETRWVQAKNFGQMDLAALFFALQDSPLSGSPQYPPSLIRRATPSVLEIELRHCPHQLPFAEIRSNEDLLCLMHSQWSRGFVYSLNQRVSIEHKIESPRCVQRWQLG